MAPTSTLFQSQLRVLAWAVLALAAWTPTPSRAVAESPAVPESPAAAEPLPAAIASAEAAWARRGEGHLDWVAAREPVAEAIARYEAALALDPGHLELRWKLLRALHFAGDFASNGQDRDRASFDRAREVAEEGIEGLAERLGNGDRPEELDTEALRQALAAARVSTADVSRFYFWAAVNWGAWGREAGVLGAVRQGVAGRMLRYAQVTERLEPAIDEGGVYRVLSTLHRSLPRVPFLTGWVDREQSLVLIERTLEIAPENPGNRFLLALTLLELGPEERRHEALAVLRDLAKMEPEPERVVEDLRLRHQARERLEQEVGAFTRPGPVAPPGPRG